MRHSSLSDLKVDRAAPVDKAAVLVDPLLADPAGAETNVSETKTYMGPQGPFTFR